MEWHGQLHQDRFVAYQLDYKRNGTFLDVGCSHPQDISNTYTLEKRYGWSGVGIDNEPSYAELWQTERPDSTFLLADAREIDWAALWLRYYGNETIDYLSLDLEPPQQALSVLEAILAAGLTFRVITFEHDYYRQPDTRDKSRTLLDSYGYYRIGEGDQDDFYVQNQTGAKRMEKQVTVAALMTAPRFEAVYARNYIEIALKKLNIPLNVSGGVFYGQCMQIMLNDLLNQDVQYALTIDFDSMFTPEHITRLLSLISSHSEIDALAAIQPKRGSGTILAAKQNQTTLEWDGSPVQVSSAHFGLTVIDLDKLRRVPKPWFHGQPNANGDWTDDKIDDDVWFWRQWEQAGNTVYIDPGCRLGHLEEMVTVFDEQMQVQHFYPKQWSELRGSTVA